MLLWETYKCFSEMRSPSLGFVKVLFEDWAVFVFSLEALLWKIIMFFGRIKISWIPFGKMHMCYCEMTSSSLGYVIVLFEVKAVFIFSVEALLWKIITFFWKGKNFMKCFCEKCTWVTLKWEATVWDMSTYCSKLEQSSFFL